MVLFSIFSTFLQQMDFLGNVDLFDKSMNVELIVAYLQLSLTTVMSWIFIPFWTAFILPTFVLLMVYISALFINVYAQLYGLKGEFTSSAWNLPLYVLAKVWYKHGRLWHGYEVDGMDNIPNEGPALLVYYHGAIPIDHYYLVSACYLKKKRHIQPVGDRFLLKIPGWELLMNVLKVTIGNVQSCAEILKEGQLLSIAPGGVLEAQFGDQRYELLWRKRIGFAKVAIEGKAPIIPVFTQNIREAFRTVGFASSWCQRLYIKTRLPVMPIFGGFPVKLRTIVGTPIPYDPSVSAEELAEKTAQEIRKLISANQRIPGSILHGLKDRIISRKTTKLH